MFLLVNRHPLSNVAEHIHQLDLNLNHCTAKSQLNLFTARCHKTSSCDSTLQPLFHKRCFVKRQRKLSSKQKRKQKANRGLQLLQCFCSGRRDDTFAWNCVGAPKCQSSLKVCGSAIECCVRKCQTQIHKLKTRRSS